MDIKSLTKDEIIRVQSLKTYIKKFWKDTQELTDLIGQLETEQECLSKVLESRKVTEERIDRVSAQQFDDLEKLSEKIEHTKEAIKELQIPKTIKLNDVRTSFISFNGKQYEKRDKIMKSSNMRDLKETCTQIKSLLMTDSLSKLAIMEIFQLSNSDFSNCFQRMKDYIVTEMDPNEGKLYRGMRMKDLPNVIDFK